MNKYLLITGTNRPNSLSEQYTKSVHSSLNGISEIFNLGNYPTLPKINNIEIPNDVTSIIWFIPTYHNAMSGYSKSLLDSLSDESIKAFSYVKHIIVPTSLNSNGAIQFADALKSAFEFQERKYSIDVLKDLSGYTYEQQNQIYSDNIVKSILNN